MTRTPIANGQNFKVSCVDGPCAGEFHTVFLHNDTWRARIRGHLYRFVSTSGAPWGFYVEEDLPKDCPRSMGKCSWRKTPKDDPKVWPLVRAGSGNGVRAEAMSPSDRCGYALIDGNRGGHWSDYACCPWQT